ncbi:MAG: fumarylacetoacetate hydrolase family protein [Pseudomonadota bacterium]
MKLASIEGAGPDGRLVVVSRDLARAVSADGIAPALQAALDDWPAAAPRLAALGATLEAGEAAGAFALDSEKLLAPLPRAYHFVDGSAYVHHMELVRRARGAAMPNSFWHDPLVYQAGSDRNLGPRAEIPLIEPDWGLDFEAELAVITDDVPQGIGEDAAGGHIKLVMLLNDISLRGLIPAELAKGFGFYQSKPASAFSPVAVTLDELGDAWDGGKLHGALTVTLNGARFGAPDAGVDMTFDFRQLIAHAAKTRSLGAGTIVGSGTVSNRDPATGSCCIAERRMLETLEQGAPVTPFLKVGDELRIEMLDGEGRSLFGAIEQRVVVA